MFQILESKLKCSNQGFTLIETLIYIAIIGGVMAAFISFGLNVSLLRDKTYAAQETQANARMALDLITRKIQSANGVNLDDSILGSDFGVLSLSMVDSALNPTIISLSQTDGVLRISQGTGEPLPITSSQVKATKLRFTDLTGGAGRENIMINLTIVFAAGEAAPIFEQSWQTAVSLRQ